MLNHSKRENPAKFKQAKDAMQDLFVFSFSLITKEESLNILFVFLSWRKKFKKHFTIKCKHFHKTEWPGVPKKNTL